MSLVRSSERRSKPSRLTAFQLLMREWSKLAPYNFIHAMRFDTPLDIDRWQKAVSTTMSKLDVMSAAVRLEQPATGIETHLHSELLRPFSVTDPPIRVFAVRENAGGHWFGTTIDHWFADDYSCRLLLEQVYAAYRGNVLNPDLAVRRPGSPVRALLATASLSSGGHGESATGLAHPAAGLAGWWRNWRNFIKQAMKMRRASRTPMRNPTDFDVRVFRSVASQGALDAGLALAKRHGATLHDLFLAATVQAFSAARIWEPGARRDHVAIASAMDLRRFDSESLPNRFGMLIGHYVVIEQRPHERSLGNVIESIATQSRRFKTDSQTDLHRPALSLWRLPASRRSKATHYLRGAPLVAGLSNVNLTGSWIEQSEITEYRRIGPTGPVVPMVLMITTLRGSIFFDVTFRTTAFNEGDARAIIDDLIRRLPIGSER